MTAILCLLTLPTLIALGMCWLARESRRNEPTDLPVIAESRRELAADPVLRWCADTEAVEAFLTLPEQRSASRWS